MDTTSAAAKCYISSRKHNRHKLRQNIYPLMLIIICIQYDTHIYTHTRTQKEIESEREKNVDIKIETTVGFGVDI